MNKSHTSTEHQPASRKGEAFIPLIRTAATLGFAVAPCSLGFVIIAVSDQLIRHIMVGDDPELLMSDLQNRFPDKALEVAETDAGLLAQVVDMIEHPDAGAQAHARSHGLELRS